MYNWIATNKNKINTILKQNKISTQKFVDISNYLDRTEQLSLKHEFDENPILFIRKYINYKW
jgi:hypothetical protein